MTIIKQSSKIIIVAAGILCLTGVQAMAQSPKTLRCKGAHIAQSTQLTAFVKEANEAGASFTRPAQFKELYAVNNENFSFDYAMTIPGQDFEIWFQVHSLRQNWASYEQVKYITGKTLANPDSTYLEAARAHATALSDDGRYFMRSLSANMLEQYNADAGKTYLINLADLPETKHYKYALLFAVQKNHVGYLMAVCLTNVKGPEFFKNINKAHNSVKFR